MKSLTAEDRPPKPEMSGKAYNKDCVVEWLVWRRSQVMAEFMVSIDSIGAPKPVITGTGSGITVYRALFAAAAEALDMGADREAVLFGLSAALGADPSHRGAAGQRAAPRMATPRQGRGSKLKSEGPQPWKPRKKKAA